MINDSRLYNTGLKTVKYYCACIYAISISKLPNYHVESTHWIQNKNIFIKKSNCSLLSTPLAGGLDYNGKKVIAL